MSDDFQFDGINKKERNTPAHNTSDIYDELYFDRAPSHERRRKHLPKHNNITPDEWKRVEKKERKKIKLISSKIMFKFFLGAFAFAVLAAGYLYISLQDSGGTVSSQNIAVDLTSKTFVDGGEDADVRVSIANENSLELQLVDLVLEYYPNGAGDVGNPPERIRRSIGTITPGEAIEEIFDVSLYGAEGEQRDIVATLEYRVPGSSSIFYKNDTTTVGIRSAPVTLVLDAPESIVANQNATFEIKVTSQKNAQNQPLRISVEYPEGFIFKEASEEPSVSDNVWDIGVVPVGQTYSITINGSVQGFASDQRVLRALVGSVNSEGDKLESIFASANQAIDLEAPFLDLKVFANQESGDRVISPNLDPVTFTLDWRNTLDETLRNIVVTASIKGSSYNPQRVEVDDGFFDSNNHEVTWERVSNEELASAEAGKRGTLRMDIDPLPLISPSGSRIERPELQVMFDIKAEGEGGRIYEAQDVLEQTVIFATQPILITETLYSSGPFPNTGPQPPQVGQKTTYSIHWELQNPANELEDIQLSTTLPLGVEWTNIYAPAKEGVTFSTQSRQVIWRPGKMSAGDGFGQEKKEVFFQVAITPSATQRGDVPRLTNEVILNASDAFTGVDINEQEIFHTTGLKGDVISGNGVVE